MKIETVRYINFFSIALEKIFKELFGIEIKKVGSYILKGNNNLKDITSVMKLTGDLHGVILISFTEATLSHLYLKLVGAKHDDKSGIEDTSNEILNIVAGQTKNLIAINYNKLIKLHQPKILIDNIGKPVMINENLINNLEPFIYGAYLVERE